MHVLWGCGGGVLGNAESLGSEAKAELGPEPARGTFRRTPRALSLEALRPGL